MSIRSVRARRFIVRLLAVATLALALPEAARAEPYMALREGFACGDCHTNRTGGGLRSVTAEMHAGDILRLPNEGKGVLPAHGDWFSPNVNEYFSVGADFRLVETLLFQDDPDANGRVENNTAFRDLESNDFDLEQGTLYAQLRLIPDMLSLYIDERIAPGGASNNEGFGLLEGVLPGETYVKAGRFFPGWGLRLEDDAAFVGAASGFNFTRTLTGVELGRSATGWNWNLSASEGGNKLDFLALANGSYLWGPTERLNGATLGASIARSEPAKLQSMSYAAYGGLSAGKWTFLVQASILDFERNATDALGNTFADNNLAYAFYGEANYLLRGWINTKVAFDWYEPDSSKSEDALNRVSIGIEPFLDRFLQLRLFYRVYNGPEDQPATNRDTLTLEAHLFF